MILHIHDEMQFVVKKDKVERFKEIANRLFDKTQQYFNFKCFESERTRARFVVQPWFSYIGRSPPNFSVTYPMNVLKNVH